jgi:hypothetical protein
MIRQYSSMTYPIICTVSRRIFTGVPPSKVYLRMSKFVPYSQLLDGLIFNMRL